MKKMIVTLAAVLTAAGIAEARVLDAQRATFERNGEKVTLLTFNQWSGDHPKPVIDVKSNQAGTTTVQAERSIKKLGNKISCEIKNGIYHPWSRGNDSAESFQSVIDIETYRFTKGSTLVYDDGEGDNKAVDANRGDVITNIFYDNSSWYYGDLQDAKGKTKAFHVSFEMEGELQILEQVSDPVMAATAEQWIELSCLDGERAFIRDEDLLKTKGVREGVFTSHGSVGGADDKGIDVDFEANQVIGM